MSLQEKDFINSVINDQDLSFIKHLARLSVKEEDLVHSEVLRLVALNNFFTSYQKNLSELGINWPTFHSFDREDINGSDKSKTHLFYLEKKYDLSLITTNIEIFGKCYKWICRHIPGFNYTIELDDENYVKQLLYSIPVLKFYEFHRSFELSRKYKYKERFYIKKFLWYETLLFSVVAPVISNGFFCRKELFFIDDRFSSVRNQYSIAAVGGELVRHMRSLNDNAYKYQKYKLSDVNFIELLSKDTHNFQNFGPLIINGIEKFILYHEYSHFLCNHNRDSSKTLFEKEIEADMCAFNLLLNDIVEANSHLENDFSNKKIIDMMSIMLLSPVFYLLQMSIGEKLNNLKSSCTFRAFRYIAIYFKAVSHTRLVAPCTEIELLTLFTTISVPFDVNDADQNFYYKHLEESIISSTESKLVDFLHINKGDLLYNGDFRC